MGAWWPTLLVMSALAAAGSEMMCAGGAASPQQRTQAAWGIEADGDSSEERWAAAAPALGQERCWRCQCSSWRCCCNSGWPVAVLERGDIHRMGLLRVLPAPPIIQHLF